MYHNIIGPGIMYVFTGVDPLRGGNFALSMHEFFEIRRSAIATVDPTNMRGLSIACNGCFAQRPRSNVEGQPERYLIVSPRILLTGSFCPVSIYMSKVLCRVPRR